MTSWLRLLFFSSQVTSFPAQGTWAGEGRSVCGSREQQGVQGRGVLGLMTLGLKEKFTLFLAMCFIDRFSTGPQGCSHRHWCETGSLEGWKAGGQTLLSCSPAEHSRHLWEWVYFKTTIGPYFREITGYWCLSALWLRHHGWDSCHHPESSYIALVFSCRFVLRMTLY